MEWIDVNERLPEEGELVLVYDDDRYDIAWWAKSVVVWHSIDGGTSTYITHWMPLPDKPIK